MADPILSKRPFPVLRLSLAILGIFWILNGTGRTQVPAHDAQEVVANTAFATDLYGRLRANNPAGRDEREKVRQNPKTP